MIFYPEGQNEALQRKFESLEDVKTAMMNGTVIESKVLLCDSEHNLHVDLGIIRGMIPREEGAIGIDDGTTRDIALISKVNKPVCFTVLGFQRDDFGNISAILSRKAVQLGCKKIYIEKGLAQRPTQNMRLIIRFLTIQKRRFINIKPPLPSYLP